MGCSKNLCISRAGVRTGRYRQFGHASFRDLGWGSGALGKTSKAQTRAKTRSPGSCQLKKLLHRKQSTDSSEPAEWETVSVGCLLNEGIKSTVKTPYPTSIEKEKDLLRNICDVCSLNPSTWEAEAGEFLWVPGQPGLNNEF